MRTPLALAACSLALLLAGCATSHEVTSSMALGPGGRVEGVLSVPAGSRATLRLANRGPGKAFFVVREDGGETLRDGQLDEAQATTESTEPVWLIVVLEGGDEGTTNVSWQVSSTAGAEMEWDLSEQYRGGGPGGK